MFKMIVPIFVMSNSDERTPKKHPRAPRAVPSFSEHRNTALLRFAMQNDAHLPCVSGVSRGDRHGSARSFVAR